MSTYPIARRLVPRHPKHARRKRRAITLISRRSCAGRQTENYAGRVNPSRQGAGARNTATPRSSAPRNALVAWPDRSPRGVAVSGACASVANMGWRERCEGFPIDPQDISGGASSTSGSAGPIARRGEKSIPDCDEATRKSCEGTPAKNSRRYPLKPAENHQISVKRSSARVPHCVAFTQQNCRFHTSLNFSRWNRCVSIPRVLSAPAPGVTA